MATKTTAAQRKQLEKVRAANLRKRWLARLERAWVVEYSNEKLSAATVRTYAAKAAKWSLAQYSAIVYALYPGEQNRKHVEPAMEKAVTAGTKTIRRLDAAEQD